MNKLKIVGTMENSQPVMVDEVEDRPIQADDIVADDSGFYRVIGGHSLQLVKLPLPNEPQEIPLVPHRWLWNDYAATIDDFMVGTGRM